MTHESLKKIAEAAYSFDFSEVKIIDADTVFLEITPESITIGGASVPQKLRALSLAYLNRDKKTLSLHQRPNFNSLGVMIDMSRGCVMKPEKVKEFITKIALCGANRFMLYTEDTYTLEEYPHLGYLRGRYTDEELRDIDHYAFELGVEVVPCIQTLGHMAQYLTWSTETAGIKDTDGVLLCGSEKTYRFIEASIKKMSSLFRSRRIHIGMDEAHDMGLGNFLKENGYRDRITVMTEHISHVSELCQKYGLQPMMWSDMLFKLQSGNTALDSYYASVNTVSSLNIAGMDPVYWDYYHKDQSHYTERILAHQNLGGSTVFAGTVYTTRGFLPNYKLTFETCIPGLKACIANGISEVLATMWGDDGCETNYFDALYGFAAYSELCYNSDASMADIELMGEAISGISPELAATINRFFILDRPKFLMWGDIFYQISGVDFSTREDYLALEQLAENCDHRYVQLLLRIMFTRASLYADLQKKYASGESLCHYIDTVFPQLLADYRELYQMHSDIWLSVNKAFGYEVLQSRYATTINRIEYALKILTEYVSGERTHIEELEYRPLYGQTRTPFYNYIAFSRVMDFN